MAATEVIHFLVRVQLDLEHAAPACLSFRSLWAFPGRPSPAGSIRLLANRSSQASTPGGQVL
jgi:hypothetical protein